jgi:SAM-dependent methyltransferase
VTADAALLERAEIFYDTNVGGKLEGFVEGNDRVEAAWRTVESWVRHSPRRVLEIGCAVGDICWRMNRVWPGTDVVGLDVSGKSIEIATRLFAEPGITFVQGTVTAAPLSGSFDVIVMLDVYEHIPKGDRLAVHAALKRLLSDDGQIVLSFPTPQHLAWLREHQPDQIQPVDEDISPEVILTLAGETGTDVVLYQNVNVWHEGDYAHAVLRRQTGFPGARTRAPRRDGLAGRLQRYWSRS